MSDGTSPDELDILEAIKLKFPGKSSKWTSWADYFNGEDIDTVGDLRKLTDDVWSQLKLSALTRSVLGKLREASAGIVTSFTTNGLHVFV